MVLLLPLYIKEELGVGDYSRSVFLSALIIMPWYFKVVFGVISDNFPISIYRRKPYLILATFFSLFGWLTLGSHSRPTIFFVLSGVCIAIGSALADSVVDGVVVEITPTEYIGRIQGVAWGSRGLGIGITGMVSSQVVDKFGWHEMFYISSVFGISISFFALYLPSTESKIISSRISRIKNSFTLIFKKEGAWNELNFFLWTGTALCLVPLLTVIMDREFEFSIVQIGVGSLIFAMGSFIGAIVNGMIFDKTETKKNLRILFLSYGILIVSGLGFLFSRNIYYEITYLFLVGITAGAFEGYQLKIIQEATPAQFESTGFAIYTGISNIGQFAIGGVLIVFISELINVSFFIPITFLTICLMIAYQKILSIKQLD